MFDPLVAEQIRAKQERKEQVSAALKKLVDTLIAKEDKDVVLVCLPNQVDDATVDMVRTIITEQKLRLTIIAELPSPELCKQSHIISIETQASMPLQIEMSSQSLKDLAKELLEHEPTVTYTCDKQQRHRERQYQKEQNKLRARFYRR